MRCYGGFDSFTRHSAWASRARLALFCLSSSLCTFGLARVGVLSPANCPQTGALWLVGPLPQPRVTPGPSLPSDALKTGLCHLFDGLALEA